MSGHSKWSKIKHQKGINDAKKGKVFSKLAQQITIAARDGGSGDPNANPSLRMMMQKAKAVSMPMVNVQKAIDKGVGAGGSASSLETIVYEGFAPNQVGVIVECLTDNKNRSISELRNIFHDNGGTIAEPGAVSWNYNKRGYISIRPAIYVDAVKFGAEKEVKELDKEEVTLQLMEISGIMDIQENQGEENLYLDIYTDPQKFGSVRDAIVAKEYIVDEAELAYVPKMVKTGLTEEQIDRVDHFVEAVEESEDVVNVWTDLG